MLNEPTGDTRAEAFKGASETYTIRFQNGLYMGIRSESGYRVGLMKEPMNWLLDESTGTIRSAEYPELVLDHERFTYPERKPRVMVDKQKHDREEQKWFWVVGSAAPIVNQSRDLCIDLGLLGEDHGWLIMDRLSLPDIPTWLIRPSNAVEEELLETAGKTK